MGAPEHANINTKKPRYDRIITGRRPMNSLKGPKSNGPRMNPTILSELSRTSCILLVNEKFSDIASYAPDGIDVPTLQLRPQKDPAIRTITFVVYQGARLAYHSKAHFLKIRSKPTRENFGLSSSKTWQADARTVVSTGDFLSLSDPAGMPSCDEVSIVSTGIISIPLISDGQL